MAREAIPSQRERSPAQVNAERALTDALKRLRPEAEVINGRVNQVEDNLLPGVSLSQFENDFRGGAGAEFKDKVRAPFSSSALVVNHFSRFKGEEPPLCVGGLGGFQENTLHFEAKCPTGLEGTPPHLDVLITSPARVLAIESKCTEHLGAKVAKFSHSYERLLRNSRQSEPWLAEMMAIRAGHRRYRHLDAAQLIKHAFGLANCYESRRVTLLYLFWEPKNADSIEELTTHRRELEAFEGSVTGGAPRFQSMTYRQLWAEWESALTPAWLPDHVSALRARYDIAIT
jgi:hypothetical protein